MPDGRVLKLASTLTDYACRIQPGDNVLIEAWDGCDELLYALLDRLYAMGARPQVWLRKQEIMRLAAMNGTAEQLSLMAEADAALMKNMDAYIGLKNIANSSEMGSVPPERMAMLGRYYNRPVHGKLRINTKWCSTAVASTGLAQMAGMSTREFTDYYYDIVNVDYMKMKRMMEPLKALMERTDRVRILGPGTDIAFSIKGMPAVSCAGEHNIPDGEVFSAPVRGSVNGVISFNTPSARDGFTYDNIVLTYRDGQLIHAEANDTERINSVLSCDDGARGVGEFSFGVNPYITRAMNFIPFDEKICGSFHFTPGNCYKECDNGNYSSLHWDLVNIQTPEYGGGEIWFDGVLIRKDGLFVVEELQGLNPDSLKTPAGN